VSDPSRGAEAGLCPIVPIHGLRPYGTLNRSCVRLGRRGGGGLLPGTSSATAAGPPSPGTSSHRLIRLLLFPLLVSDGSRAVRAARVRAFVEPGRGRSLRVGSDNPPPGRADGRPRRGSGAGRHSRRRGRR